MTIFKKTVGFLHLWLGLTTGLVVFLVSITGCIYAFQKEIQDLCQSYRFVPEATDAVLPPSRFEALSKAALPQYHLHAINYPGKGHAVESIFYGENPRHYYVVYHHPNTANILHTQNMDDTFFRWILMGHYYLWLPENIGQVVVSYSCLIFVLMLVSGIILWWPKNKSASRQRFRFRWKPGTRWKRKNYDLHHITGFYAAALLLIIGFTGMVFGLQWFAFLVYKGAGGEKSVLFESPVSAVSGKKTLDQPAIDQVWHTMIREHPDAVSIEVHTIESDSSVIAASANTESDLYWTTDYRYFDQYTLQELPVDHLYGRLKDADAADKLVRMNYDIHVGAILGLPGKILACLLSLVAASLPVTGCMIWYGRHRKKHRRQLALADA